MANPIAEENAVSANSLFSFDDFKVDQNALRRLPPRIAFRAKAFPIRLDEDRILIAVADSTLPGLLNELRFATACEVEWVLADEEELEAIQRKFYGIGAEVLDSMDDSSSTDLASLVKYDLNDLGQEAAVVQLVNQLVWEAFDTGATDIHIEPMETDVRVRYRIDGVLRNVPVPTQIKNFQSAIISRMKVMSNMDIAEKRLPQDGRISMRRGPDELDIRASTMPTAYGESVSLRLLRKGGGLLTLDTLGLSEKHQTLLRELIEKPHGILLATGPTGSGKSTSLYAWLDLVNRPEHRIITVEDPIEYEMVGINQVQVAAEVGLSFATGLRHILRQDPDIIMIGEIRDHETAEIAIRAALTGHLVFSTLHTNDAVGAIMRLIDMGIEPFLAASSIEGVIAQRLLRRLCPTCREIAPPATDYLVKHGFPLAALESHSIYRAVGCDDCFQTGYRGRQAICEIMQVTDPVRNMIHDKASVEQLKQYLVAEQQMRNLRQDGWDKVCAGITSVEEVLRVTDMNDGVSINAV